MDKIVTYKYAFGKPRDLREGNLDSMFTSDSLNDFNCLMESRSIVTPEFIGVYQQEDFVFHDYGESMHREEIEKQHEEFNSFLQDQANHLLMMRFGHEDVINPNLIHVIYDKDSGWKRELVRECLKDSTGRVVLSNVANTPDFGRKNTRTCYSMMVQEMRKNHQDMKTYLLNHQAQLEEVSNTASIYGLTREEYAFLQILKDASKKEECSIIDDSMLIGMTDSLLEHFPDNPFMHDDD